MQKHSIQKRFTAVYSSLQAEYFIIFACIGTFASVFLDPLGYTNKEIGFILGTAYLLAVLIQPLLADFADRTEKFSLMDLLRWACVLTFLFNVGLIVGVKKGVVVSVCYVSAYCIHLAIPPLLNQLNFAFEHLGIEMNFGFARACGSIGFSLISIVLGYLVSLYGVKSIPLTIALGLVCTLISLNVLNKRYELAKTLIHVDEVEEKKDVITLKEFLLGHKMIVVMNLGIVFLIFHNVIYTTYMYQIMQHVGGGTVEMGKALGLMAFLEVPALMYFHRLTRKYSTKSILRVSLGGFLLKNVLYIFAKSCVAIYIAQACQLIGFALFMPSMIRFMHERTLKQEEVKGQAIFSTMFTAAGILASYVGGFLIDHVGVSFTLRICFVLTLIGAFVVYVCAEKIPVVQK